MLGLLGLNIILIAAMNIPGVQRRVGAFASKELSALLQTKVEIGRIDLGIFNQLIIENIDIEDQLQKPLLHIDKLAASLELLPLLHQEIRIHTGQIFRLKANLYQEMENNPTNFQFIIDALSSKDEKKEPSKIDLRINSFILRDGSVSYHQLFKPKKETFDVSHLDISKINVHVSLKELKSENLLARIRELSFEERSGLAMKNMAMDMHANKKGAEIRNFFLELPNSIIRIDSLSASYNLEEKFDIEKLQIKGGVQNSVITLSDLKAFIPKLKSFDDPIQLSFSIEQNGRKIQAKDVSIFSEGNYLALQTNIAALLPKGDALPQIMVNIDRLDIQPAGFPQLFNNLELGDSPSILSRLGKVHLDGLFNTNTKDLAFKGLLGTAVGQLNADIELDKDKNILGTLTTTNLNLGSLLAESKLGNTAFDVKVNGNLAGKKPIGKAKGEVRFLEYNLYKLSNINLDANLTANGVEGILKVDDPNCNLLLEGVALNSEINPSYTAKLKLEDINPHILGLMDKNATYSGEIALNAEGKNIDTMLGEISLSNFSMIEGDSIYQIKELTIEANKTDELKTINLDSDFLHAKITGEFQYSSIPQSIIKMVKRCIPSLISDEKEYKPNNNFSVTAKLSDATPLNRFLNVPLTLYQDIQLDGLINDAANAIQLNVAAGSFDYNGEHYELGKIRCNSDNNQFTSTIGVNKVNQGHPVTFLVNAIAKDDNLITDITWDNNQTEEKFAGNLNTRTRFQKEFNEPMNVNVSILPSEAIINDTSWNVRPSMIDYRDKKILVSNLAIENGPRHLIVNGIVGNEETDTLRADLKEINLEYVFDALNFHPVDFSGIATGKALATNLLNQIDFDAKLFVRNFHFEHGLLGNMNLHGKWDKESEGIYFNGYISEFASESNDSTEVWKAFRQQTDAAALTHVEGIVSPKHKIIDLSVDADRTNLHFLESFVGTIFKDIQGRATGWAHIGGTFKDIDLTAAVKADVQAKVISLNTNYKIHSDSIFLKTNKMEFNSVELTDKDGHHGKIQGTVDHYYLHNMKYNFDMESDNMLCFETHGFDEDSFYATAYVGGNVNINGESGVLKVTANVESKPGTIVAYNASTPEDITNTEFITFVDKTPGSKPIHELEAAEEDKEQKEEEEPTNIYINMNVNCTPDATIRVLMDNVSGDDITCHGTGNIQAEYFNKGAFKMYGIFNIVKGVYKMSLQEIIRKDFNLKSGTVTFNGKPFDGQLDVQAVYTVNSASLRDLSPSATFSQKSTTRVNCLMNLTGNLLKPSIAFDLELPNVTDEDQSMVKSLVATEDQMNRQIIYLLGIGRFYTDEYNQDSNQTNQAMNSLLTSTISGQFNEILSQVANNNNWNFGANLNPGHDGLNNMEFQTMLSGSLFNNRLLINGNFGYRENALANTNFVGDFDLQWLLNQSGTISLKAYNETNDRYFTKNTLTTQGIGIQFKKDFNHWSDFFKRKKKSTPAKTDVDSTKILKSDFIKFNE